MRISAVALSVALFVASSPSVWAVSAPTASPKLTVVIVVDQMRADYLDRFSREYVSGFSRLEREGAVFTHARHAHVPTETAPGHATLLTGCSPAQHGIVGNTWWDRASGRSIYAVNDDDYGVSPANLLCKTLGDVMKVDFPGSRVVSISGKDRAAILMGGHKPDLALWYDTSAGQFISSPYYGRVPDWVWNWDAQLRIPPEQRKSITTLTLLDSMTLELSRRAIEEEKLGQRGVPDLLTISLSVTDLLGHASGPDSIQMHDHLVGLDRELGLFFDYLDHRIGSGNYVLALSSDHGVLPVPESEAGRSLHAKRLGDAEFSAYMDEQLGRVFGAPPAGKSWVLSMTPPNLYLNLPLAKEKGISPESLKKEAAAALARHPLIVHVYYPDELAAGRSAKGPFAAAFQRGFLADRSGDLIVLFKEGVLFGDYGSGTGHGTPYEYDAEIPLVLMGAGVRPGTYPSEARSTDLAPTLAQMLGIELPSNASHHALLDSRHADARPRAPELVQ